MKKYLLLLWKYLSPIWTGNDGLISLKCLVAIGLFFNFIFHSAISDVKAELSLFGCLAILGIKTIGNFKERQITENQGEDK